MVTHSLLGDLGVNFGGFSGFGSFITSFVVLIIVGLGVGLLLYLYLDKKAYNLTIWGMREINGSPQVVVEDRARTVVLPFTSVRAILLKKQKIFLPRPSIEFKKNHYVYQIRRDGEWVNIGFESLDDKLQRLNIFYDHADMRYGNASLKKLVEKEYKKLNFLKEYAPYIGFGLIIILLGISGYLFFDQAGEVVNALTRSLDANKETVELQRDIIQSLDRILIGSGTTGGGA